MTAESAKSDRYNARESETRWQKTWDERGIFRTPNDDPRPKYYVLEMFPYPSGRIHMGHVRNYTMGDVVARFKRARGMNVLHPMGWDAFGMPAENAAMERKVHPKSWTYANIAAMKKQLQSMGLSLDWSREVATCDPAYYKHQQRMFLDFLKAGLVERKQSKVNWDPVDMTVLANEQVIDGRGWRSGALVEQKELTQWFFKISDYSEDLLNALDKLDRWPEKVRLMQKNWIGRSEGLLVRFELDAKTTPQGESEIEIFTTRPDTLFGAKFVAIAPDHPLAKAAAAKNPKLAEFIAECKRHGTAQAEIDTAEKLGFDTGIKAVHPFDGAWTLPVYVANFILMEYGTGAIFGCPAHDDRDLEFANKYKLGNTPVVCPPGQDPKTFVITDEPYLEDGTMINSRFLDGMTVEKAKDEVAKRLETQSRGNQPVGQRQVNYRLRDWGISRQRYWGCPIPIIHCEACGVVPVPVKDLPVQLPEDVTFDKPGNPLDRHPTWRNVPCPQCGKAARRETDTMDTFVELVVVLRALHRSVDRDRADRPQAGRRMASGRSIHRRHRARDFASALFALLHPRDEEDRPRRHRRAVRGSVHPGHGGARDLPEGRRRMGHAGRGDDRGRRRQAHGEAQRDRRADQDRRHREDVEVASATPSTPTTSWPLTAPTWRAGSCCPNSPPERDVEWTERGVQGSWRFTNRLWRLVGEAAEIAANAPAARPDSFSEPALAIRKAAHGALSKVTDAVEKLHFNVCVAHIYEFANALGSAVANAEKAPDMARTWLGPSRRRPPSWSGCSTR